MTSTTAKKYTAWLPLIPFIGLLMLLPYPGTVAGRLLLLVLAFGVALNWQLRGRHRGWSYPPCRLPLLFWIAVSVVSLTYAVAPTYSLGEMKNEIGYTMAAFFAFHMIGRDRDQAQVVLRGLAAGLLLIGAIALFGWFRNGRAWPEYGIQGGSGSFATYLVTCLPAMFWLTVEDSSPRGRLFARAMVALAFVLAFLTLQRAVWPALIVQMLVAMHFLHSSGRLPTGRWLAVALALAICAVGAVALVKSNQLRGMHSISSLMPSDQAMNAPIARQTGTDGDPRIPFWSAVIGKIAEHPFAGAGFGIGSMKKAYPDLVPPQFPLLWHAHNAVLNYAIQMGWPGALALLGLFGGFARYFWRCRRLSPAHATAATAGLMLLAGVFLRNQTNDFFSRDLALLFWCLLGVFSASATKPAAKT